ncbi:hypothetical protein [Chitinophaga sp. HK235]|uniref:hypothetical protein n=1 Tax=Chitinophaga sp. HK235 TaxID=2952571 RepID=UPI001BA56BF1|nr:hypothetical protein [Chitinophaga sp. HK235]
MQSITKSYDNEFNTLNFQLKLLKETINKMEADLSKMENWEWRKFDPINYHLKEITQKQDELEKMARQAKWDFSLLSFRNLFFFVQGLFFGVLLILVFLKKYFV